MPSTYAGVDSYPAAIQLPTDGDPRNASSVNVALEALADRTAHLKATVARGYLLAADNIVLVSTGHVFPAGSAFAVADQDGLKWPISGDTPFASDVRANDILEIDFSCELTAASPGGAPSLRLVYSETATDFVSGTWFPVVPTGGDIGVTVGQTVGSTTLVQSVSWSLLLNPLATTGHVRFAIAGYDNGAGINTTLLTGRGRFRWWRAG